MFITRRDGLVAAVAVLVTLAGWTLAAPVSRAILHSAVFQWADLKPHPTKVGMSRSVVDAPTPGLADLEIHVTTLNTGQSPHPPHHHVAEELMILREGTLEAMQQGRTNIVQAGGIIFEASNEEHGLRNIGTNPATYYVIKFLPPGVPAR